MQSGYYWFREAPGLQLHILHVADMIDGQQPVIDITGRLKRIRGPRYADKLKGIWWLIDDPESCFIEPDRVD